jgi:hypothetical protein
MPRYWWGIELAGPLHSLWCCRHESLLLNELRATYQLIQSGWRRSAGGAPGRGLLHPALVLPFTSPAELGPRFRSGVHVHLAEDSLGMVSGRMGADPEGLRNRHVGAALSQEKSHFGFPLGKSEVSLQEHRSGRRETAMQHRSTAGALLPQLLPQLTHFHERAVDALEQRSSILPQRRKRGQHPAESLLNRIHARVGRLFRGAFLSVH